MVSRLPIASLGLAVAAPASQWRDRVVYQVITDRFAGATGNCSSLYEKVDTCTYGDFCGGTFDGLVSQLDDIKNMGFDAVWISPVVANVACGYTGYWAKDLYTIAQEYGGQEGLRYLVDQAHKRDIYIMVDVVFNHMGHTAVDAGCRIEDFNASDSFADYRPFDDLSDYHQFNASVDWSNWTNVEDWWLFCLPDVDTENPRVIQLYLDWINNLIRDFGIDGIRIDTIPYVPKTFWSILTNNISSHTFATGEVNTGDCWSGFCPNVSWYASYQQDKQVQVLDSILNFPASEAMRPVFGMDCRTANGKQVPFAPFTDLQTRLEEMRGNFSDLSVLGNFVDNHDTARFLMNRDDPMLLKNNLVFMMGMDGIPIVYYGTEVLMNKGAVDPEAVPGYYDSANLNRWPLWMWPVTPEAADFKRWLTHLLAVRRDVVSSSTWMEDHFVDSRVYTFLRGEALFVAFNVGSNVSELAVQRDMLAPARWRDEAVEAVCNLLSEEPCLDLSSFEERFRSTANSGWWTADGSPQVWAPAEKPVTV
jgi:alpha-amylase